MNLSTQIIHYCDPLQTLSKISLPTSPRRVAFEWQTCCGPFVYIPFGLMQMDSNVFRTFIWNGRPKTRIPLRSFRLPTINSTHTIHSLFSPLSISFALSLPHLIYPQKQTPTAAPTSPNRSNIPRKHSLSIFEWVTTHACRIDVRLGCCPRSALSRAETKCGCFRDAHPRMSQANQCDVLAHINGIPPFHNPAAQPKQQLPRRNQSEHRRVQTVFGR